MLLSPTERVAPYGNRFCFGIQYVKAILPPMKLYQVQGSSENMILNYPCHLSEKSFLRENTFKLMKSL